MQDAVPGIVESLQQLRHRQLLRAVGGIAFQSGTLVGFCGTVGTSLYECRVVCLFKLVLLEVIQQVQPVIGQFGLLFLVLLELIEHFLFVSLPNSVESLPHSF